MIPWTAAWLRPSAGRPGSGTAPRPASRSRASPWTSSWPRRSRTSPWTSRTTRTTSRPDEEDEDAGDEDVDGLLLDDGPDPRAGRLVAEDEGAHPDEEEDLVAYDAGIAGGGATAEEAAMHVVEEDDYDIRSDS